MEITYLEKIADVIKDVSLERLRELVEADKNGRCMILPCKVGDTVYKIYNYCHSPVDCINNYKTQFCKSCEYNHPHIHKEKYNITTWPGGTLGKNIFITLQEAEEALKRMGEE